MPEHDDHTVLSIAKICHEANRAYCESLGDYSQLTWEQAEEWQRQSAIKGVRFRLDNPNAPNSAQHDAWLKDKELDGWKYGPTKNPDTKEHPCLVTYDKLSPEQQKKDALFTGIVNSLR